MKIILKVEGMHCEGCRKTLENELNCYDDIENVDISLENKQVTISTKNDIKIKELEKRIKKAGFKSLGVEKIGE